MILPLLALLAAGLFLFSFLMSRRIEARFPPRGEFVSIDGRRLHVARREPAGAARADVLLIHGASGNCADMMLPLADLLAARGYRVVAVDRPGHGYSDALAADAPSPAAQAQAIRTGVERLGVKNAIVVGHSWAGSLAANLLLDHADFCDAALLLAPVTHPWPGGVRWYYKLAASPAFGALFARLFVMPLGLALLRPSIDGVFAPSQTPANYADRIGAALALRPRIFRNNARDVANLRAFLERQAPRMNEIRRPVAIVTGDHDGVVLTERHSFGSARNIEGATLTIMKGVGHSPHWADPNAIVEETERLFARVQSARAMRPDAVSSAPATSSQ
ncbi:MAG: alpha/beta hydrolase [Hyphomicrobiales bacterium]|nr:alpha/beta hydrolase [Hyphomicrobiales bacterium]